MSVSLLVVIAILFTHLVADFFLQTDWMATEKSKNFRALMAHTILYSATFAWLGLDFVMFTFITHTMTDFVTSRITTQLWQKNERHWFFVVIGVDQFIHYVTLLLTWYYLFGGK